jgi:hypothetical protein
MTSGTGTPARDESIKVKHSLRLVDSFLEFTPSFNESIRDRTHCSGMRITAMEILDRVALPPFYANPLSASPKSFNGTAERESYRIGCRFS